MSKTKTSKEKRGSNGVVTGPRRAGATRTRLRVSDAAARPKKRVKVARGGRRGQRDAHEHEAAPQAASATVGAEVGEPEQKRDPRLPAVGTVLVKRDRNGRARCECTVEEAGIRYDGVLYRSLSGAATAAAVDLGIKGRVNGYLFWGIIKAVRPQKDPGEYLRKVAARYEEQVAALLKRDCPPETRTEVRRELEVHAAHLNELLAGAA